ncbi:hypothetical protein Hanom_Chr12g01175811 [Helianthus anomalus]
MLKLFTFCIYSSILGYIISIKSIIYIKTKHFGATWHYLNRISATCHLNIPHDSHLSGNTCIHFLCFSFIVIYSTAPVFCL